MPYAINKQGNRWVVRNTETGDIKGTHATREDALKQIRLLYMIEHGGTPRKKSKGGK
jgi:hypothetical protein